MIDLINEKKDVNRVQVANSREKKPFCIIDLINEKKDVNRGQVANSREKNPFCIIATL
jgi:hypothetical protein